MILRTHLAITVFIIFIFFSHVEYPLIFALVCLIASLLPDIDTYFSKVGNLALARPIQFFTKHRGMIHSLTLAILVSLVISFLFPSISLAFFLGYSIHVFIDSFTIEGVQPFWPYKFESKGVIKSGSYVELSLFVTFCLLDAFLLFVLFL